MGRKCSASPSFLIPDLGFSRVCSPKRGVPLLKKDLKGPTLTQSSVGGWTSDTLSATSPAFLPTPVAVARLEGVREGGMLPWTIWERKWQDLLRAQLSVSPAKAAHTCRLSGVPQPCLGKYVSPPPQCPQMQAPAVGLACASTRAPRGKWGNGQSQQWWQMLEADNPAS